MKRVRYGARGQQRPGLICAGEQQGVGLGHTPPIYRRPGQVMSLNIDGLEAQRQTTVAAA